MKGGHEAAVLFRSLRRCNRLAAGRAFVVDLAKCRRRQVHLTSHFEMSRRPVVQCQWNRTDCLQVGADVLALADARIELFQDVAGGFAGSTRARQRHHVAMRLGLDTEPLFEQGQMPIELAQQPIEMAVVLEGHNQPRLLAVAELLAKA